MDIVIPAIVLGAAYSISAISRSDNSEQPIVSRSDNSEQPIVSVPVPDEGTKSWRGIDWSSLVENARGSVPHDFLLRWIEKESGGNPCSVGMWGGPWEAGIGQIYFSKNQREDRVFGVTLDELRESCSATGQTMVSPLTEEQKKVQVSSLVLMASQYISVAGDRLFSIGERWSASDILCLAKLYHALPVLVTNHLSAASRDGHTQSWDSYRDYVGNMSREEVIEFDIKSGYSAGRGAAPYWPLDRLFANAQFVGRGF